MIIKRFFIYFLLIMIAAYPASAADVSLSRWVLNVTLHDDGTVEEVIQTEIDDSGSLPLDGFSFIVPASSVTVIYDFVHTSSLSGQTIEQHAVQSGTKITVDFNKSVEAGNKWDGRIGFTAQNWAAKEGSSYSINIPVIAPQAIVAGKSIDISIPADADIRSQVFLPTAFEVTSVTPVPFRILFQYDHMVPTWTPDKLHIGDTISIKSSYSSVLNKITTTDIRWRDLKAQINEAEKKGMNVSEAKTHLNNAEDYNTNLALGAYWKKDYTAALESNAHANDELNQAERSLSPTPAGATSASTLTSWKSQSAGGFETISPLRGVIVIIVIVSIVVFLFKRRIRS